MVTSNFFLVNQLIENSRIDDGMTLSANPVETYELPIGILDTKCIGAFTTTGPAISLIVDDYSNAWFAAPLSTATLGVGMSTTPYADFTAH